MTDGGSFGFAQDNAPAASRRASDLRMMSICLILRSPVKKDDFDYAIENTQVILAPEQKIATFGSTSFRFYLISELMDRVNEVRVRDGKIHADRPQILTPEHFSRLLLEGFGEKAQRYVEQMREHLRSMAVLRYGFQFRKTDVTEETTVSRFHRVGRRSHPTPRRKRERTAQRRHPRRGRRLGSLPAQVHHRHDRTLQRRKPRRLPQARTDSPLKGGSSPALGNRLCGYDRYSFR